MSAGEYSDDEGGEDSGNAFEEFERELNNCRNKCDAVYHQLN